MKEIISKLDEILFEYERRLNENFKYKFVEYFARNENILNVISARDRLMKAKLKNNELLSDFLVEVRKLLNDEVGNNVKSKTSLYNEYREKFIKVINNISDEQYKVFNNFIIFKCDESATNVVECRKN